MNEQVREGVEFSLSFCRSNHTYLLQENTNKCQELSDTLLTCDFPNQNMDVNPCHVDGDGDKVQNRRNKRTVILAIMVKQGRMPLPPLIPHPCPGATTMEGKEEMLLYSHSSSQKLPIPG